MSGLFSELRDMKERTAMVRRQLDKKRKMHRRAAAALRSKGFLPSKLRTLELEMAAEDPILSETSPATYQGLGSGHS